MHQNSVAISLLSAPESLMLAARPAAFAATSTHYTSRTFYRPRIVLSQCLELAACRYDGRVIPDSFVATLFDYVDIVPICPEIEIGLGVPRDTIRMVDLGDGHTQLMQPSTGKNLTERMERFSQRFLDSVGPIDGFILKSGSPSCGTGNVKVYGGLERAPTVRKGAGLFATAVQGRFGHVAVEDEGRLRNYPIRDDFLIQIFSLADLRALLADPSARSLVDFQRRYKHLLMAYDEPGMRELGRIVANHDKRPIRDVASAYAERFRAAIGKRARRKAHVNVLMHMFGHFSDQLSDSERHEFLRVLDEVRNHHLPLITASTIIRTWTARYDYAYFADQAYLEPYPRELVQMRDSGKGLEF